MHQQNVAVLNLDRSGLVIRDYLCFLKRSMFHRFRVLEIGQHESASTKLLCQLELLHRLGVRLIVPVFWSLDREAMRHIESAVKASALSIPYGVISDESGTDQFVECPYPMIPVANFEKHNALDPLLHKPARLTIATHSAPPLPHPDVLDAFVGASESVMRLKQRIRLIACSDIPVLIEGETGTGKEIAARMIHTLSSRKNGPFRPIDCPAIPDSVFENEVFGHEKGAYTGAESFHKGIIAQAEGGTLLLDEVDKLSLCAQAKLLRFLQEKSIAPLGSGAPVRTDVRIIAASGNNLPADLETESFRKDLFFRLRGVVLKIPPLRERPEDIIVLAEHFLSKHTGRGRIAPRLAPAAAEVLLSHHWPGNARELENVIRVALLVAENGLVLPCHLELPSAAATGPFLPLRRMLLGTSQVAAKSHILRALALSGGSRHQAADMLGISRRTLSRLISKLRIDCQGHRPRQSS